MIQEAFVILFSTISEGEFKQKDGSAVKFLLVSNKKTRHLGVST